MAPVVAPVARRYPASDGMSEVSAIVPELFGNEIARAAEAVDDSVVAFTPVPMTSPEAAVVAVRIVPCIAPDEVTAPAFQTPEVIVPVVTKLDDPARGEAPIVLYEIV